ncbi:MAG: hypothetical protein MJY87_01150 [Fibrobacter sp.]|nr:hypothetical protein [Fibrobacter sp.]
MTIKKEYEAPKMNIVDMKFQTNLLSCSSCDDIDDFKESDDEFGFNYTPGNDRQA